MTNMKETIEMSTETIKCVSEEYPQDDVQESDPFISDEARKVIETILYAVLCFTISVVGSAANVINILIFFKQGFKDSANISLCGLSISDLCILLSLIWISTCFNPLLQYSDAEFDSVQVQSLTGGWPSACFARITSWITAFITFERCVCIALPMKVKDIITPKRTFISIVVIFLVMVASVIPVFCSTNLAPYFNSNRNKTLLGISYANNGEAIENNSYSINVLSLVCSFIIVIVCTVILIYNLRVKSQWRHKVRAVSSLTNSDTMSTRDKRVMKMVTSISCIFIVCYVPDALNVILIIHFTPDYSIDGRYHNTLNVSWAIINTFGVVNSSINILVYYNMSSKFRMSFKKLFTTDDSSH